MQLGSLSAPAQTLLIAEDSQGRLSTYEPQAGNGVIPAVPQAAAVAYLGYAIGRGIEKSDGDRTEVRGTAISNASSDASAGAEGSNSINYPPNFIGPRWPPGHNKPR